MSLQDELQQVVAKELGVDHAVSVDFQNQRFNVVDGDGKIVCTIPDAWVTVRNWYAVRRRLRESGC